MILIAIDELNAEKILDIERLSKQDVIVAHKTKNIPYEDIEILITYGLYTELEMLNKMPNLKWIQVFRTGIEHLPLKEIESRGITLSNVRDIYGDAMSEYVMSIILYQVREIERFIENKNKKLYDRTQLVDELSDKTIGIFGAGLIGIEIAEKAQAFNMNVLGYNTTGKPVVNFDDIYTPEEKEKMISDCDFIVLLLPLTEQTHHFISDEEFNLMKEDAYLINIGRGPLVDEKALLKALEENKIKGAALDVFTEEPLKKDNPLWNAERLIITPHLSGKTRYFYDRCISIFSENYLLFSDNKELKYQIDFKKGY